jgi:hypothetical protein
VVTAYEPDVATSQLIVILPKKFSYKKFHFVLINKTSAD